MVVSNWDKLKESPEVKHAFPTNDDVPRGSGSRIPGTPETLPETQDGWTSEAEAEANDNLQWHER